MHSQGTLMQHVDTLYLSQKSFGCLHSSENFRIHKFTRSYGYRNPDGWLSWLLNIAARYSSKATSCSVDLTLIHYNRSPISTTTGLNHAPRCNRCRRITQRVVTACAACVNTLVDRVSQGVWPIESPPNLPNLPTVLAYRQPKFGFLGTGQPYFR